VTTLLNNKDHLKKDRICFLIEDDIDDQELFELALREIDNSIHLSFANDGAEGLQKLQTNLSFIPDFIFIDINMPKMNGIQCLPEIKKLEHLRYSKIVMYSTTSNETIIKKTRQLGADEFLVKPYKMSLLIDNLTRILEIK
jgi:CheY-like chemotaxis protein